jgi:uncharacterized protein YkuJ
MRRQMTKPDDIARYFTQPDASYRFARWGRPMVPVAFGLEPDTLAMINAAFGAVARLTRVGMAETDPEMGANLMIFGLRDWSDLRDVPDIDALVPGLVDRIPRLQAAAANQYRLFRFEANGAIRAAFLFLRVDAALASVAAADLALDQAVRLVLLWAAGAFTTQSPLGRLDGVAVLRPEVAALIRAAYDPVMPDAATDASHALRLAARL